MNPAAQLEDGSRVEQANGGAAPSATFPAMGTTVQIVIVGGKSELLQEAQALVEHLESMWSRFLPNSEISKLNRAQGSPCIVSKATYQVVAQAVSAWESSDGAFDPTVEACIAAAGYSSSFEQLGSNETMVQQTHVTARSEILIQTVSPIAPAPTPLGIWLDPTTSLVQLPPGATLDLGGIAKGAAADLVADQLLAWGAAGCCVNIGGDIRVLGQPPRNSGWSVDLDVPGCELPRLALQTGAVCTSTTRLRRWKGSDGVLEHHIRNPFTGHSSNTDLESVVIVAQRAVQAEVLAKMVLLGGSSNAEATFEKCRVTGFVVTTDGSVIAANGIQEFITGFS